MSEHRRAWRSLSHNDRTKYARGMRRLWLGIWGYPVSTLRSVHLTTKEGNDNTPLAFAKDLRKLIGSFRGDGYDLQYDGALEFSPERHLLHWHGLFRIKGGYFIKPMIPWQDKAVVRRTLGDRWNECHGAFVVDIEPVTMRKALRDYILKHVMKEYIGVDEDIRNKFLFSKGWMREGWKKVEDMAKLWTLGGYESDGGLSAMFMNKEGWSKVNEIVQAWAERETIVFHGEVVKGHGVDVEGKETGYLSMELGRIREVSGSAFLIWRFAKACFSSFEYIDF